MVTWLGVSDGPGHTVQMHSSSRSPLSGIPVRTAPAAAVSPIQVYTLFPFKIPFKYRLPVSGTVSDDCFILFLETLAHKATIKDTGKKN